MGSAVVGSCMAGFRNLDLSITRISTRGYGCAVEGSYLVPRLTSKGELSPLRIQLQRFLFLHNRTSTGSENRENPSCGFNWTIRTQPCPCTCSLTWKKPRFRPLFANIAVCGNHIWQPAPAFTQKTVSWQRDVLCALPYEQTFRTKMKTPNPCPSGRKGHVASLDQDVLMIKSWTKEDYIHRPEDGQRWEGRGHTRM